MPVKQGNGIMCTQVHYSTAARTARSCKAAQGPARSARVSDVIAISEPREFVPDVWICFTNISHPPPPRSAAMKRSRVLQADRPSGGLGGWATGKARARARRPATRSGIAATAAAAVARAAGTCGKAMRARGRGRGVAMVGPHPATSHPAAPFGPSAGLAPHSPSGSESSC